MDYSLDLTKSLERSLDFVQSKNAANDIDLLIVIQTFIKQATFNLKQYLDPSIMNLHLHFNKIFKFLNKKVIKRILTCLMAKEDEEIYQIAKDMMIFWMKMTSVQVFIFIKIYCLKILILYFV